MDSYLTLHFIWDFEDTNRVKPVLDIIQKSFARDKEFPFSRRLNLPLFFYCSDQNQNLPSLPQKLSEKNLVFIFISENLLSPDWEQYLNDINFNEHSIIPVAFDQAILQLPSINLINAIRIYDFTDFTDIHTAISMAHEIYCHGLSSADNKSPENNQVKIFLSHCKADNETGVKIAQKLKAKIDNETTIKNFFDSVGIGGGENFETRIKTEIKNSTLICINSDQYSSRFWCQKEILLAKENNRPIIGVDCLTRFEDRAFPYKGNFPFIRYQFDQDKEEECLYNILFSALVETIRFHYINNQLQNYINNNWLDKDTIIFSRPPEFWQLATIEENAVICYPEPPIYSIELEQQLKKNIQFRTPLWNPVSDYNKLENLKIGISISDFEDTSYITSHISLDTLKLLSQDVARYILSRSASLVYGGDLRPDGFTDFLLDEAQALYNRTKNNEHTIQSKIYNHLAWYIHSPNPGLVKQYRTTYYNIIQQITEDLPEDIKGITIDKITSYEKARCLTHLRETMIAKNNAQIFAGGKHINYSGILPGILEEFLLAAENNIPIFLFAGFSGITNSIYISIKEGKINEKLTEEWQISNNANYQNLLTTAENKRKKIDFTKIKDILENMTIEELASRSGLTKDDYIKMAETPFIDIAIYYLLQGLENKFKKINNK